MENGYERTVVFLIGCFLMLLCGGGGGGGGGGGAKISEK